jgi:hypothetical protein
MNLQELKLWEDMVNLIVDKIEFLETELFSLIKKTWICETRTF